MVTLGVNGRDSTEAARTPNACPVLQHGRGCPEGRGERDAQAAAASYRPWGAEGQGRSDLKLSMFDRFAVKLGPSGPWNRPRPGPSTMFSLMEGHFVTLSGPGSNKPTCETGQVAPLPSSCIDHRSHVAK